MRILYKNLYLNRNYEDLLGQDEDFEDPNTSSKKFSQIIQNIANKQNQIAIFQTLVNKYNDEAHYYGHLGRFLYETAITAKEFEDAETEILNALDFGEKDYNLWHLKGMCNRRKIEYLIREYEYLSENNEVEDIIKELSNIAQEAFAKSREYNEHNLHSHTSEIQMLNKVINFGKQISTYQSSQDFLLDKNNSWYENKVSDIFNLLDEAQYVIDLSRDVEQSRVISKSTSMIEASEGTFFSVLGNFTKAINKFKRLSELGDRQSRPFYGKMYVYSTLASKVGNDPRKLKEGWKKLSDFEFQTLKTTLERSIREQPENPHSYKLLIQAMRHSNVYFGFEQALGPVKTWYDNSLNFEMSHLEALYYRYVLHACKAIDEGESFGDFDVTEAKKYINECKQKSTNDKYSFEWYGNGKGIKKMVNHGELGSMKNDKGFFEKVEKLGEVQGTISNIFDRQSGKIILECGLETFFVPARGGFEKGKDEGVTKVKFYVGFRYNGLTAWEVTRINSIKPVYVESEKFEIEGFDQDIEEVESIADIIESDKEIIKIENLERPKLKGLTLINTIDISQFDKYKKKK
ncbi:hypothetical protein [Flavobacterium sp. T12S277]|uniref:hypothetical protein n=1 Tax=Flavobacterium sp. T12S277 TaxID=3402752 RepID=UPI003AE2A815